MNGCTVLRGRSVSCILAAGEPTRFTRRLTANSRVSFHASLEIVPNALTLLVPPEYLARERSLSICTGVRLIATDGQLTHSLTGLALSRAGLDRLCPRAAWLLILSANVPDSDIVVAPRELSGT